MRKIILFITLIVSGTVGFSQDFPGYTSGNYTGVNGVFTNPANIADSRYRWDFNLFGIHTGIGNNNASFKIKNIGDFFDSNLDSILIGSTAKNTNAIANVDVYGPSVLFNISPKTSIALTTRVRALANIKDLDGKLIQSIDNDLEGSLPITLSSNANQKIVVNGWADFGVSLAHVLYSDEHHFLKAGITAKYLAGVANTHANIASFKGTADEDLLGDTYITNASGAVSVGISGVDVDNFEAGNLVKFKSSGFGADAGLVYEYRPHGDANTVSYPNKYKFKIAVSLLDMGSIKYTPDASKSGAYSINISSAQKWYPQDLDGKSIEEIKAYLDASPYFTSLGTPVASYKTSLPTNLQVGIDYNIHRGFFVGLNGQLNVAKTENKYTSIYNDNISLIPRYEKRAFGIYVPLTYNELTNFNAGVAFRFGPVYFGSGSILTALFDKSKQADFHFGLRFGKLKAKNITTVKNAPSAEGTAYKTKKHKASKRSAVDVPAKTVVAEPDVKVPAAIISPAIAQLDSDGDGIMDKDDKCPTVMGLLKYNGCPIPDTDKDGVNDEVDKCIDVAGLARYNGCPIPDSDNDGINDEEDNCPATAGTAKYKGCPVPDTDGDGINDDEDKCPGLVGNKANFGCPEVKKGVVKKEEAPSNIKKDVLKKITTAAKGLQFATGKSVILKKSYIQLNNVVKVLKADPALSLSIEGYTDNVGVPEKNLQLSKDRANAAKAYLVKKGIDESRITADGFGSDNPIASNKTAAGRTKNRRVVFTLSK